MTKRPSRSRTIQIEGLEDVLRKLGDRRISDQPMLELLEEASKIGVDAAIETVTASTGRAAHSIHHRVWSRTLSARVYTMMARVRTKSIDKGRKKNEGTTIERLAAWEKKAIYHGKMHIPDEERSKIIRIWKAVKEKGVRGKTFVVGAKADIEAQMPHMVSRAMERLKELANRR